MNVIKNYKFYILIYKGERIICIMGGCFVNYLYVRSFIVYEFKNNLYGLVMKI